MLGPYAYLCARYHVSHGPRRLRARTQRDIYTRRDNRKVSRSVCPPRLRGKYNHKSFILLKIIILFFRSKNLVPIKFGQGKADSTGVAESGKDAVGVELFGMAKVKACFRFCPVPRTISDISMYANSGQKMYLVKHYLTFKFEPYQKYVVYPIQLTHMHTDPAQWH